MKFYFQDFYSFKEWDTIKKYCNFDIKGFKKIVSSVPPLAK